MSVALAAGLASAVVAGNASQAISNASDVAQGIIQAGATASAHASETATAAVAAAHSDRTGNVMAAANRSERASERGSVVATVEGVLGQFEIRFNEVQDTSTPGVRPGWGCGDKNHTHTGPPGNPGATSPCK